MDLENAPHRDPEVIEHSRTALLAIQNATPYNLFAIVATEDGFEVTSIAKTIPLTDDGKVAAMVSSISSLSDAISDALDIKEGEYVIISGKKGTLVVRKLFQSPLVIAGVFDIQESLGKAIVAIDLATAQLKRLLGLV